MIKKLKLDIKLNFKNIELIIVDENDSDETPIILGKFILIDKRILIILKL